jgi:hypothetical protein
VTAGFELEPNDQPVSITILDDQGAPLTERERSVSTRIELAALEERGYRVVLEVDREIPGEHGIAVEVVLHSADADSGDIGSLGFVLIADDRE